nr:SAM-dependent chlorinase/fluorinase [Deltaproteobacteria bacterium]
MAVITLTTDFGTRDGYVGAMKGVIARLCNATVVDLAHDIPRHDIAHAAWVVATACLEFPRDTIHVVVVDPGVGGARRGVIVRTGGQLFVGPDNGVFGYVANEVSEAWEIRFPRFMARRVSPTFHGRDVFAPSAALLHGGESPNHAGPMVKLVGTL